MGTPRGLALIDPHGDLALQALEQVPTWRAHELVYFNPNDFERPIGLNVLGGVPIELVSQHPFCDVWLCRSEMFYSLDFYERGLLSRICGAAVVRSQDPRTRGDRTKAGRICGEPEVKLR